MTYQYNIKLDISVYNIERDINLMLSVTFLFCRYGKVCSIANVCLLLNHLKSWEITAFMDFHLIFWNIKMYFESCEKIWQLFHRGIFISGIYLDRFNWNYSKQLSSMLSLQKIWFVKHQISITSIKRRQSYSTNYVQIFNNFLWVFLKQQQQQKLYTCIYRQHLPG